MKDYVGHTFGRLKVVSEAPRKILERPGKKKRVWRMVNVVDTVNGEASCVMLCNLTSGVNKGVGHYGNKSGGKPKGYYEKYVGKKFGRLTVVGVIDIKESSENKRLLCKCECGSEKAFALGTLNGGTTVSCGCYRDEYRKRSGDEHPAYIKDRTKVTSIIRNKRRYEVVRWAAIVKYVNGNCCARCGVVGGPLGQGLDAHHIKPFGTSMELAVDINNGVPLCRVCHRDFHSKYGRMTHDKSSLEEFLGRKF